VTDAWMPGAERIPAPADGGCLKGGAPRAVWLLLYANPLVMSARTAAERLIQLGRPCHLVWNPVSSAVAQMIPVVRAGRALGWPESQAWLAGQDWAHDAGRPPSRPPSAAGPTAPADRDGLAGINSEGRICAQIAVISQAWWPCTGRPARRLQEIVSWLDSWQVPRGWPAGRPAQFPDTGCGGTGGWAAAAGTGLAIRRNWAQGGHFTASQLPGCTAIGAGRIDLERLDRDQARARSARRGGNPARIAAMTRQPRLTPARSAAP